MDTDVHGSDLTKTVIGSAFEVANVLGGGFLEKVYEKAIPSAHTSRTSFAALRVSSFSMRSLI
jgi:hypothetical protein